MGNTSYERGSAVLETAFAIPALFAITLALLWAISLGVTHVRIDEAAYAAARLAARGATVEAVRASVRDRLPAADVAVAEDAETITVTVTDTVFADVPILRGVSSPVSARAIVAKEGV